MKLLQLLPYNIAKPEELASKTIQPTVPLFRMDTENDTTLRICTPPTLDGCLTALGPEGIFRAWDHRVDCIHFNVLCFETEKIGWEHILTSRQLAAMQYVPDVLYTEEHWLLTPCEPEAVRSLYLVDFYLCPWHLFLNGEKYSYFLLNDSRWTASPDRAFAESNLNAYRKLFMVSAKIVHQHSPAMEIYNYEENVDIR